MKTVIIGAGGHARAILDILSYDKNIEVVALIDNFISTPTKSEIIMGIPVYGDHSVLTELFGSGIKAAIIGIGKNDIRKEYFNKIKSMNIELINAIHPTSNIAHGVKIGKGIVISANSTISTGVSIGNNTIINTGAIIEHESIIEDNVHISSGCVIAGRVKIKEGTFVGAGSVVKDSITIGKNVIIGAGSVVLKDIPDNTVAVGTPAKVIKTNI